MVTMPTAFPQVSGPGGSSLSNVATSYLVDTAPPEGEPSLGWGAAIGIFLGAALVTGLGIAAALWHRARARRQAGV